MQASLFSLENQLYHLYYSPHLDPRVVSERQRDSRVDEEFVTGMSEGLVGQNWQRVGKNLEFEGVVSQQDQDHLDKAAHIFPASVQGEVEDPQWLDVEVGGDEVTSVGKVKETLRM